MDSPGSSSSSTSLSSSLPNHYWVSSPFAITIKNLLAKRVSNENRQEHCFLQTGGLGVALSGVATKSPFLATLASNPAFVSAMSSLLVAQSSKVFLNFLKKRQWDLKMMLAFEGMPSTHSALCSAITTSVALSHGVADSLFPVSLGFSLIVMYDAVNVRRHVGYQAEVVNAVLHEIFKGIVIYKLNLKEDLGDTLPQVLAGALLGYTVAVLCSLGCTLLH